MHVIKPNNRRQLAGAAILTITLGIAFGFLEHIRRQSVESRNGVLDSAEVRQLYDRVAPFYDLLTAPYRWFGAYNLADQAIAKLYLQLGDTVVDLGTGTGRNLAALAKDVGPSGRVIGVDISPAMLAKAAAKIDQINNIELVEADISTYQLPPDTRAVISTYAIEMLPDYDQVVARLAQQMPEDGRIATTGLKEPERWPEWLIRLASAINRPFGVAREYRSHRPWEAIHRYTTNTSYSESLAGALYLAAGTTERDAQKTASSPSNSASIMQRRRKNRDAG